MSNALDQKALWDISYGIYVVTSVLGDKTNAQIANSVFQAAVNPPLVAVSINKNNLTHEYIQKSGVFTISTLDQSTPMTFIGLFGFKSGRDVEKLSQVACKQGHMNCPIVIENALSYLEGRVIRTVDAATHTVFIAEVIGGDVLKSGTPLTYAYYQQVKKGKSPKNATTYKGDYTEEKNSGEKQEENAKMKKYVCSVCGYIYDPEKGDSEGNIPAGTPFAKLPDDWVCPVCGASKDEFEPED